MLQELHFRENQVSDYIEEFSDLLLVSFETETYDHDVELEKMLGHF
jgi:hypothetical protein